MGYDKKGNRYCKEYKIEWPECEKDFLNFPKNKCPGYGEFISLKGIPFVGTKQSRNTTVETADR
jgi:hypothetical protein